MFPYRPKFPETARLGALDLRLPHMLGTLAPDVGASPDGAAARLRYEFVPLRGGPLTDVIDAAESVAPFRVGTTTVLTPQKGYADANSALRSINATLRESARVVEADRESIRLQRDALLRVQRLREELSTFLVHDLKSPISSIVLNALLLSRDASLGGDQADTVRHIANAASAMNRLVLDLLDVGRTSDGALVPRIADVDVSILLHAVATTMRARGVGAQQSVVVRVETSDTRISADADLLLRVLENLLDNALRHGPRGSTITIDAHDASDDTIEIRVHDLGAGILVGDRERVFDKYVQLDAATGAQPRTGHGLGLVFCRVAIEAHRGRIWVEEGQPNGAVFVIRLPRNS